MTKDNSLIYKWQRLGNRLAWLPISWLVLAGLVAISLSTAPMVSANVDVGAGVRSGACLNAPPTSGSVDVDCPEDSGNDLQSVIRTILNVMTWIVGIATVFVVIIAGFRYVISGASSSGVTGAKNMIIYALIGIVIALLAQVIVRFVIGNVDDALETNGTTTTSEECVITTTGSACTPPGAGNGRDIECTTTDFQAGETCKWVEGAPVPEANTP